MAPTEVACLLGALEVVGLAGSGASLFAPPEAVAAFAAVPTVADLYFAALSSAPPISLGPTFAVPVFAVPAFAVRISAAL